MFDRTAQSRLREKLDYELWLLDFLSKTYEILVDGADPSKITLRNRQTGGHVAMTIREVFGAGEAMKVMDATSPLTFTAAYKILDMIFEWILEENHDAGRIGRVPWKFSEKVEAVSSREAKLVFPPLFQLAPYVRQYLFALYSNLLKFRNEIVHKHRFSMSGDKLLIDTIEDGKSFALELDREELSAFVRTLVVVANLLAKCSPFGLREDRLLKYHLDQIQKLHSLRKFDQRKPILVDVVLEVPGEKGLFPADLKFVRGELSRIYPNVDVQFNLEVVGLIKNQSSIHWFFPANSVPEDDVLQISQDSYREHRVSLGGDQKQIAV